MQEESKGFGNNYDHEATRRFFRRWWKVLLVVLVLGAVASGIAAWCIKPLYKSSAVIFPTNSNRLSKAIMDYHYSLDFMDYGIERDCEYAIQILSSKRMEQAVCDHFNLKLSQLDSRARTQKIAYARQVAMYLSNQFTGKSHVQIGVNIGNRNHATVIHAIRQIKDMMEVDDQIRQDVTELQEILQASSRG